MIGCQCRPDKGTRSLRSRPRTPRLARESPASYPVKSLWPVIYGWNPVRVPEKLGMQAACRCSLRTRLEPELSAQALGGLWVYGSSWVWAGLQVNWLQQYYWLDKYTRKVAAPPRSFRAGPPVQTLACEGLILYRWYGLESRVSNTPARQVHAQGDRHSAVFRGRVGDTELEKPWKGDSI